MGKKDLIELPKNKKTIWLLLAVVLILVATNSWLFFSFKKLSQSGKEGADNGFSMLNPARKFLKQEDLIINLQPLRDYLNGKYGSDPSVSIYFEYLPTGANISVNKDAEFYPASLLKIPVAMAVAKKIDSGNWGWNNKLVLMATDKDDGFGTLYKEPTGSAFTIEELVRRSLAESDNTAHFILLRNLEVSELGKVYAHLGLDGFLETDGSISAKRYSVILRALYNASFLSDDSSQKIISFLEQEGFDEYLESGLPKNVLFAHKIGIDKDKKIYLDSGIIYLENRPYVLIVMTKSKTEQQAKDIMKDVSERVFNYVKEYKG